MLLRMSVRAGALGLLLFAPLAGCGPQAAPTVASAEACDHGWAYMPDHGGHFGVTNSCNTPISIWFMVNNGSVTHADVAAGEVFDSGLAQADFGGNGWAAATCPAGFTPKPAVSSSTYDAIQNGQYSCERPAPE